MAETLLSLLYGAAVLLFGIALTAAFYGLRPARRNFRILLIFFACSGTLQLLASQAFSTDVVWTLYPLITHLPLILLLRTVYKKPFVTGMVAAFTAYLFCQPSKWIGLLVLQLTQSEAAGSVARILCLSLVGYISVAYLAPCLSDIFNKDRRSVLIFGIVPTVYYVFDYVTAVYTDLWRSSQQVVMEFLPFFLSVVYVIFCLVYYREYEQKADAQRKEQIVSIMIRQQSRQISAVKQAEQEIRMLRHDMRLLLSSLAVCLENRDADTARELIDAQIHRIDGVRLERFCGNEVINYVISDYAARCKAAGIPFRCAVALDALGVDEILFASILSNALDNSLNAQQTLPPDSRGITLMLKRSGDKLLLSVKNPVSRQVSFSDGLPVAERPGHGYGTQSIRYLTERLGGNCQFSVQDNTFIVRVVI